MQYSPYLGKWNGVDNVFFKENECIPAGFCRRKKTGLEALCPASRASSQGRAIKVSSNTAFLKEKYSNARISFFLSSVKRVSGQDKHQIVKREGYGEKPNKSSFMDCLGRSLPVSFFVFGNDWDFGEVALDKRARIC